jgi:hypothetical protein
MQRGLGGRMVMVMGARLMLSEARCEGQASDATRYRERDRDIQSIYFDSYASTGVPFVDFMSPTPPESPSAHPSPPSLVIFFPAP